MILLLIILASMLFAVWTERPVGFILFRRLIRSDDAGFDFESVHCVPCNAEASQEIRRIISLLWEFQIKNTRSVKPDCVITLLEILQTHTCDDHPGHHKPILSLRPRQPLAGGVDLFKFKVTATLTKDIEIFSHFGCTI